VCVWRGGGRQRDRQTDREKCHFNDACKD